MSDNYKMMLVSHLSVGPAIGVRVTPDYAKELIEAFANAMEAKLPLQNATVANLAQTLIVDRFASNFRPGVMLDANAVVDAAIEKAAELAALVGLIEVPVVEVEQTEEQDEFGNDSDESGNESEGDSDDKSQADESENKPEVKTDVDLSKVSVDSLPIHGTAKKAYKSAGLLTVADLELFAQSRSLDAVNGIGPDWAADTLKAIEALKA